MINLTAVNAMSLDGTPMLGATQAKPYTESHVAQFSQQLLTHDVPGGAADQLIKVANLVESKFNNNHHQVVQAIKNFDSSGSAVALMQVTHIQANNSVMVQLFGDVGKKTSDETEQLYKQQ